MNLVFVCTFSSPFSTSYSAPSTSIFYKFNFTILIQNLVEPYAFYRDLNNHSFSTVKGRSKSIILHMGIRSAATKLFHL